MTLKEKKTAHRNNKICVVVLKSTQMVFVTFCKYGKNMEMAAVNQ